MIPAEIPTIHTHRLTLCAPRLSDFDHYAALRAIAWRDEPQNARSITLGLRIGGVIDPTRPGIDPGDLVIRHDVRARP